MAVSYKITDNNALRLNDVSVQISEISRISIEDLPKEEWHSTSFNAYGDMLLIILGILFVLFIILLIFSSAVIATITVLIIGGISIGGIISSRSAPFVPTARVDIILKNGMRHGVGNFPRSKATKIQKDLDSMLSKMR